MDKLVCFIVFFFSSFCYGDASTSELTVKAIGTDWGGESLFVTPNEVEIVEGCSFTRLRMLKSNEMFDENLSILLSALHSHSKVVFRVSGCDESEKVMDFIAVKIYAP